MRSHARARVRPFGLTFVVASLAAAIVIPSGSVGIAARPLPIEITKTADAPTVDAGDQIGYTVTVTNPSRSSASDVLITDTLPANAATAWTISPSMPDCEIVSGVLQCSLKRMQGQSSFVVHIVSPTASSTCGVVSNQASVTTKNAGSATSEMATIAVQCPDLIVETIAYSAPPGYPAYSYTVTVHNQGAGTADISGVSVQGYYAATEGTYPGSDGAGGQSFNPGVTLASGANVDIIVGNSAAPPPSANWLVIKVDAGEVLGESDETNNINSAMLPHRDLIVEAIDVNASGGSTPYGYTVTVHNQGNATASLSGVSVQGYYSAAEDSFPGIEPAGGQSFSPGATLAAGASVDIVVGNYAAPPPSTSWIVVKVDYGEVLAESNETNNIGSAMLQ